MRLIILSIMFILFITGCRDNSSKQSPYLMNHKGVNPNSLAYSVNDKLQDRANKVELSKIDADAKIEIAKIESGNKLLIAKVNADATKKVAQTDSKTKIQTTQIDAIIKKDDSKLTFYIAIALIFVVIIALVLLYLNTKQNRELKAKMHADKLRQELDLKEQEHQEQRLYKMLDLMAIGKLSPQMEEEIIRSVSSKKPKTIESKK